MLCLRKPSQEEIDNLLGEHTGDSEKTTVTVPLELQRATLSKSTREEYQSDSRFASFSIDHHR